MLERRQRNRLCSMFSRLPPELAITIFEMSLPEPSSALYFKSLLRLTGVCSAFLSTITAEPSLWAVINARNSLHINELAFNRSQHAPLIVQCAPVASNHQLLSRLVSEGHRTRVLRITTTSSAFDVDLTWPAPLLEELALRVDNIYSPSVLKDGLLFDGQLPRLRDLTLEKLSLQWEIQAFNNLTRLSLSKVTFRSTFHGLLDLVDNSPNLNALAIKHVYFEPGTEDTSKPKEPRVLHLPHLVEFELEGLNSATTTELLCALHFPTERSNSITISCDGYIDRLGVPLSALQCLEKGLKRMLREASFMEITVSVSSFNIVSGWRDQGVPRINLYLPGVLNLDYLVWLSTLAKSQASACPIDLKFTDFDFSRPSALQTLGKLRIVNLDVESSTSIDPLLQYLGNPSIKSKWPLSRLKTLIISAVFKSQVLLDMLRSRYVLSAKGKATARTSKGTKNNPKAARPLKLHELRFIGDESMDEELFDEVTEIVGENVADWDHDEYSDEEQLYSDDYDDEEYYDSDLDYHYRW